MTTPDWIMFLLKKHECRVISADTKSILNIIYNMNCKQCFIHFSSYLFSYTSFIIFSTSEAVTCI